MKKPINLLPVIMVLVALILPFGVPVDAAPSSASPKFREASRVFYVNPATVDQSVVISWTSDSGSITRTDSFTLAAGAIREFDLASMSDIPAGWNGHAVIDSPQGLNAGYSIVRSRLGGTIHDLSGYAAPVTISYRDTQGAVVGTPCTVQLGADQSVRLQPNSCTAPPTYTSVRLDRYAVRDTNGDDHGAFESFQSNSLQDLFK